MGFLSLNRREENVHTTSRFNLISTAGFFFVFFPRGKELFRELD